MPSRYPCESKEMVDVSVLKKHPKNPNKHTPEQIERLAKLITTYGFRHPIIVSKRSGYIIAGHGRLEAAKKLGMGVVPVDYQDFESEELEYGFLVADNAIAGWAELDLAQINAELENLGPDFDIDNLGLENFVLEPADKPQPVSTQDAAPDRICSECGQPISEGGPNGSGATDSL